MYTRYEGAAVWLDATDDPAPATRPHRPPIRILWATRPFRCRLGHCLGIRLAGDGVLQICVSDGLRRKWLPASHVLTERQASAWIGAFKR